MRRRAPWLVLLLLPLALPAVALALGKLTASPADVAFPTACLRTTSRPSTVTVANGGDTDVENVRVAASPSQLFIVSGATAVPTLTPGAASTVGVRFVPGKSGSQSGEVRIDYEAVRPSPTKSNKPAPSPRTTPRSTSVDLSGSGIDRFIDAYPRALNFGDVRVQREGPHKSFVVYDDGDDPLHVSSITLGGEAPGDFTVSPRRATTVTEGNPLRIVVGFTPHGVGARAATLTIRSDSCTDPSVTIDLAGIGVEPDIVTIPQQLDFGKKLVGKQGAKGVTIYNQGGFALRVAGVALGGLDIGAYQIVRKPHLPDTLEPGGSIDMRIRFHAIEPGRRDATLLVTSNDPDHQLLRVPLRGLVTEREIVATPSASPTVVASPTLPPEPSGGGFDLGEYAPEVLVAAIVAGFFVALVLLRRMRGIPE